MRAALLLLAAAAIGAPAVEKPRPLLRDFLGLNGHTVQFRPALYAPVAKLVRDYHPVKWDLGDDPSFVTTFPFARNRVDWSRVYGSWREHGLRVNACLLFDDLAPAAWRDPAREAAAYGAAFARYFGPGGQALVESVEIGNEPGQYSDEQYRNLFTAMAGAIRRTDPALRIATCAANLGPSGRYSKSVDLLAGHEALYDILSIHLYAEAEPWPTWRRSFPEDPATKWVENLRHILAWRREHAPDKEVWLTEFGYDATTQPAPAAGDFKQWLSSTEVQQAHWIVRSWLIGAREGLDRAYLYFFNDDDEPKLHASSGLTRRFRPKPAYHAAAWLQRSLGDYRFARAHREELEGAYVYEFTHGIDPRKRLFAAWQPRLGARVLTLPVPPAAVVRAEVLPLDAAPPGPVAIEAAGPETRLPISEAVTLVWVEQ
jgi:hypothetical protein